MIDPEAADAARASEAFVDALGEATELARSGEGDKSLADVLCFGDDLLDIEADYLERRNAGEASAARSWGCASAWPSCGDTLRALPTSLAGHSLMVALVT